MFVSNQHCVLFGYTTAFATKGRQMHQGVNTNAGEGRLTDAELKIINIHNIHKIHKYFKLGYIININESSLW